MREFDIALVLSRVMTSGIVMSIERNDRELPGLERLLAGKYGSGKDARVSLHNSRTAGIHAAVAGLGIGHGESLVWPAADESQRAFLAWLGVTVVDEGEPQLEHVTVTPDGPFSYDGAGKTVVLDLSPLGFGPAAAVVTDEEVVWQRAERLKIFGAFDLRTMWTQEESLPELVPGVQFNYRLSPLVAACIRSALTNPSAARAA